MKKMYPIQSTFIHDKTVSKAGQQGIPESDRRYLQKP